MLNLPKELFKPYTWIRIAGKSSMGYLISPLVLNDNTIQTKLYSLLIAKAQRNIHFENDFKKYIDRSGMLNVSTIFQLIILLFLWVFAGSTFSKYQKNDHL